MNETDPRAVLLLAAKALDAMDATDAAPGEKVAALKTAAFAIEQAQSAQQLAVVTANIINGSRPR